MLLFFLNFYRIKWIKPRTFFSFGVRFLRLVSRVRGKTLSTNIDFFKTSNLVQNRRFSPNLVGSGSMSLYFVATNKDFAILRHSVMYAKKSLVDFNLIECGIIVPDEVTDDARTLFGEFGDITIIAESTVVKRSVFAKLRPRFGGRSNWIYQQLLKVSLVRDSNTKYCLIVDADTLLLSPRLWTDRNNLLGLTPTDESNADYFDFITRLAPTNKLPTNSFVPHHMCYDVELFGRMLREYKINTLDELIHIILEESNRESASPVSIDYELFGQWVTAHYPQRVNLMKWANLSIPRVKSSRILESKFRISILRFFYNSVSFHDYS
jgi:hypothetical protein